MKRRHEVAIGLPIVAFVALCSVGVPGASAARGAGASAATTTQSRAVSLNAASAVPTPKGKPALDATFHGSHLNKKIWDTCYPNQSQSGCRNFGNPEEAEWYLPSQVKVSGGSVRLIAQREKTRGKNAKGARETYYCRSGMLTDYPGLKFKYGFVQVVANIPHSNGLWSALWLGTANNTWPPEIDMLESWGVNANTGSFYHPVTGHHSRAYYSRRLTIGWHTYSLSWTKSKLAFYVDKRLVLTVTKNVPHQAMYFVADLAEYQPAKRGTCTGQLSIKSVKIWTP
jgi:beta-glucanase (GH16 family)